MKKIYNYLFLFALISISWAIPGLASDLAKEKRWSEQIVDSLLVGDEQRLKAGDSEFLGIFAEASGGPSGRAVILLHGIGAHPDWPDVISPLRSDLPDHGWSTLSIQLPVLANDAALQDYAPLFDEAGPRIAAAAAFLREQGNRTVVLIGHSLGASMGASWLAGSDQKAVNGFVAIGMSVIELDARMNSVLALEKIRIPTLDLYGSRDLDAVLDSNNDRFAAARKSGNKSYRQMQIEGADHMFVGLQDDLVRRIYGWLKTTFEKPTR